MTLFYLLTAVICSAYVLLMLLYLFAWHRTAAQHQPIPAGNTFKTFASIIIPVRDEEETILNCLHSIYGQQLPASLFEVIVVDDHSSDKTSAMVDALNYPNLRLLKLPEGQEGKKRAITAGVKIASGSLIITTDADCEMGENWLASILSCYERSKPKMIVAPVLLKGEKNIQQIVQGQEMTVLTASACAALYHGFPILCSGANLIYEKNAFAEVQGFEGVERTSTGDDVFLMLKIYRQFPKGIMYLKSANAAVYTHPAGSSSQALKQRKRWASKSFSYGFSHVTWIAVLVFLTNFLILFSGIMSAINLKFVLVPIICFSAKFLVDLMLLTSASSFFNKKTHLFVFSVASVIYPAYVSAIGLIAPFTGYSWKSRKS